MGSPKGSLNFTFFVLPLSMTVDFLVQRKLKITLASALSPEDGHTIQLEQFRGSEQRFMENQFNLYYLKVIV
jgi:hypothetical protein